jgi:hypothetical protein
MSGHLSSIPFAKRLLNLFKKSSEMPKGDWIDASNYKQLAAGMRSLADKHLAMRRPQCQCWYITERLRMSDGKIHRYFIECTEIPPEDMKDFPAQVRDPNAPSYLVLLTHASVSLSVKATL